MKHCLVVDESRAIRQVVCNVLEDMKFYAEETAEASAALEACRVQMPDVVLVSIAKPGAIDFVRALRRDKSVKQPVIIASMIEHDADQICSAVGAGIDAYVLKPFDRACLTENFAPLGSA
ncbi:MAG TPA: response regulator [Rhizomicrobium sp.]|nr:response regulator [Rhizomicrobium sp.]